MTDTEKPPGRYSEAELAAARTSAHTESTSGSTKSKRRYMHPDVVQHDTLRRHIKRALPVPLTRDEQTDIAIAAAKKRRAVKQLEADLKAEKERRQAQINDLQREIDNADRELDTGEQERTVMCNEIFKDGQVFTLRTDTWEAFEQRAATAQEAQRFLPAVEAATEHQARPVSGQAGHGAGEAAQKPRSPSGPAGTGTARGDVRIDHAPIDPLSPEELAIAGGMEPTDGVDADEPEDDGLTELTPAQLAAKEAAAARRKRREQKNGGGK